MPRQKSWAEILYASVHRSMEIEEIISVEQIIKECHKVACLGYRYNYMIMTNQGRKYNAKDCVLTIDGEILSSVSNTKFLRVILDDKLTFDHIDYSCSKVSKLAGIFYRVRKSLTKDTLVTLYNTLLRPYFINCISICGNTCKSYLKRLGNAKEDCPYHNLLSIPFRASVLSNATDKHECIYIFFQEYLSANA